MKLVLLEILALVALAVWILYPTAEREPTEQNQEPPVHRRYQHR